MRRTMVAVVVSCALVAVPAVPAGQAAEPTREGYVARVEPICRRDTEANRRIFAGARGEVKAGRLKQASTHFTKAEKALDRTIRRLKAVPGPAADEARLGRWISYLERESSLVGRIGRALAQGRKGKAQTLSVRLDRNSNLANNAVLAFGFTWCRLDPSRFT